MQLLHWTYGKFSLDIWEIFIGHMGNFLFCTRQFALHRQQPEKDKQNVDFAPPLEIFLRTPLTAGLIRRQNHNGFTCRLMCADAAKCAHFLIRKEIFDWKHALERLRSHEQSMEHMDATITFSRRCN